VVEPQKMRLIGKQLSADRSNNSDFHFLCAPTGGAPTPKRLFLYQQPKLPIEKLIPARQEKAGNHLGYQPIGIEQPKTIQ